MKFNDENLKRCTEQFCKNPFWRTIYENATDGAKRRLEIAFWGSTAIRENEDMDTYRLRREQAEDEMTYEEIAYLAKEFPEGAGKKHYQELCGKRQFAALKTPEKLDAAIDMMIMDASEEEREAISQTRKLIDAKNNPFVDDDIVWAGVGGNGDQCHLLGDIFDHGHDVAVNEDLAFFWFRRGALAGDGDCCCRLAALYEDEDNRCFDFARANFWYREALRRNNGLVKWMLGYRLVFGHGEWGKNRNPKLGVDLLRLGLEKDSDGESHYYLGKCYEEGAGVEKDLRTALRLYKIADERSHQGAHEALERLRQHE